MFYGAQQQQRPARRSYKRTEAKRGEEGERAQRAVRCHDRFRFRLAADWLTRAKAARPGGAAQRPIGQTKVKSDRNNPQLLMDCKFSHILFFQID